MRIAKHLSVMLPNKPGQLASVADKLARAGVNIEYVYGSGGLGAQEVVCVFGVTDIRQARKAI